MTDAPLGLWRARASRALAAAVVVAGALAVARAGGGVASPAPRPEIAARGPAVGLQTLRLVDSRRTLRLPDGEEVPRTLVTEVRYPAVGTRAERDLAGAPPLPGPPRPLVVFAHGFATRPDTYAALLRAWVRAGFVVAAPVFPRSSAGAPGGPERSDIDNQPADLRLVISSLLAATRRDVPPWNGLVDPRHVAVAGHSDGAITALAAAYDRRARDRRVTAAMSLAGAWLPGHHWAMPVVGSPALLVMQGTADATNAPANASELFELSRAPHYLLWLLGADHLRAFTRGPRLALVERATIAFLDRYLASDEGGTQRLLEAGRTPGLARMEAGA